MLSDVLKSKRKELGLTLLDIAKAMNVSEATSIVIARLSFAEEEEHHERSFSSPNHFKCEHQIYFY